jgi:UDP-N-acetylmuramoyl-tripeptide--D-alanyl-D-alanine ligase
MLVLVGIGFGVFATVTRQVADSGGIPTCPHQLTQDMLYEGVSKGVAFIAANQLPAGNFQYEYNWKTKEYTPDDNSVRQAGTVWGLALAHRYAPSQASEDVLHRALAFFETHTRTRPDGALYVVYPGETDGSLGTVALIMLAHLEYLQSTDHPKEEAEQIRARIDGYIRFLTSAITQNGGFASRYTSEGKSYGEPSPYYDGEALLALIIAARHAGYASLEPQIKKIADAGYVQNVERARKRDADSPITKGYYQWSSMAYYQLLQTDWSDTEKYGPRLIELAHWMIDTHQVLNRQRNTAYAYEGILSAYAYAVSINDTDSARTFRCVIEKGLGTLMTWQLSTAYTSPAISAQFVSDPRANGGIQNSATEPLLRIDVTQHQVHAMLLALRYLDF